MSDQKQDSLSLLLEMARRAAAAQAEIDQILAPLQTLAARERGVIPAENKRTKKPNHRYLPKHTDAEYQLLAALSLVRDDAKKRIEYHQDQLDNGKPPAGREAHHAEYHQREIDEAKAAMHYCFIRSMRIDPD